jgi:beta-glucosidase
MGWRVEAGEVDISVGASSVDLRLTDTVRITSDALVKGATRCFYAE